MAMPPALPPGLGQKLAHQRGVPWVWCVWDTVVGAYVMFAAESFQIRFVEGLSAMLKWGDVVDFESPRSSTLLAAPSITI